MCCPAEFKTYYIAGVAEWFSLVIVSPRRGFDSLHRLKITEDYKMNNFQKFFVWLGITFFSAFMLWQLQEFIVEYIEGFRLTEYFITVLFISIVSGIEIFRDKNKKDN